MRQHLTDAESSPNLTPRAPTRTSIRAPSPQAQSDAANTAEQAPAAAADAQLLQRSEATIATRPNPACTDAANLHDPPFVDEPNGTAAGIQKLADRLLAGMLLAALRPDTIPALLRTITTQRHPTVSSYLRTMQLNLGHKNAQPTLADILTAPTPSPAVPATSTVPTPTRHSPRPSTTSNTPSPDSDTPMIRQASTYTSQR
jgi:hypothetical protein